VIERLLPDGVVAVEAWRDSLDAALFPEEELTLGRAVDKRRREFTTGRACARAALAQLGVSPMAIAVGERGEPRWPAGIVGSITHCDGYRACAVACAQDMLTVGIDAEPHAALPSGVLADVARERELAHLDSLRRVRSDVHWDRLLFSAKESVYKAWSGAGGGWLGFEEAEVTADVNGGPPAAVRPPGAVASGTFRARLRAVAPPGAVPLPPQLDGRWLVRDGLLLTAVVIPRSGPDQTR
jgi:4'-phosphopantetheinyl transferase EntD